MSNKQQSDPFSKVHRAYCDSKRLDPSKVKFEFDGLPLDLNQSPRDQDMEDQDIIEAKVQPGAALCT